MSRFVIDDKMWNKLEKLLPAPKGRHGENDRLFIETVCWIIRDMAAQRVIALLENDELLDIMADKLNNRPRKTLGYKTPKEVFSEAQWSRR